MKRLIYCCFIVLLVSCQPESKTLPILSYKMNTEGERETYSITYSNFTNQDGLDFSTETIKGKVIVASFFFTRCPSICPPMQTQLTKVANAFKNRDDVMLVSHSIDPKNDTVSVLKTYAEATGLPSSKWQFLTAKEAVTKAQAAQFMTNFKPNDDDTNFFHSSYVVLVDKNQLIRGFYNILLDEEVYRLNTDIKSLTATD